jgi:hypothetical protein
MPQNVRFGRCTERQKLPTIGQSRLKEGSMFRNAEWSAWPRCAGKLLVGAALVISPIATWSTAAEAQVATCLGLPATIIGTPGHDVLNGTPGNDVIIGLAGDDTINGLGGNDTLFGDACGKTAKPISAAQATTDGNDKLNGGDGNDTLYGAGGNDKLNGANGNDRLFGGGGNDTLTGGKSTNTYKAGAGNDTVNARNRKKETIDCGTGKKDKAIVDKKDKTRGCETVKRSRR